MPVKFCSECQNMLTAREDVHELRLSGVRRLMYACRTCDRVDYQKPEETHVPIHRNIITHSAKEMTAVNYDVSLDPTLPRTNNAPCPSCGNTEAVYYQSPVGKNDEALILVFVCCVCQTKWLSSDQ